MAFGVYHYFTFHEYDVIVAYNGHMDAMHWTFAMNGNIEPFPLQRRPLPVLNSHRPILYRFETQSEIASRSTDGEN